MGLQPCQHAMCGSNVLNALEAALDENDDLVHAGAARGSSRSTDTIAEGRTSLGAWEHMGVDFWPEECMRSHGWSGRFARATSERERSVAPFLNPTRFNLT